MRLQTFIQQNRPGIDEVINSVRYRHDGRGGRGTVPNPPPIYNDKDRREWILNDEGLYRWAKGEGVPI